MYIEAISPPPTYRSKVPSSGEIFLTLVILERTIPKYANPMVETYVCGCHLQKVHFNILLFEVFSFFSSSIELYFNNLRCIYNLKIKYKSIKIILISTLFSNENVCWENRWLCTLSCMWSFIWKKKKKIQVHYKIWVVTTESIFAVVLCNFFKTKYFSKLRNAYAIYRLNTEWRKITFYQKKFLLQVHFETCYTVFNGSRKIMLK